MNRPPTSFSHSSRGMTRRPVIGGAPRRGKPFAKCWRSGSARGPPPGVACSVSETLRFMAASRPSYSPATRLSPRRIACSTRVISSQTPAWSSARSGGFGPVSEYRPGPLQLLRGGDDHRDLDRSAPCPKCLPEAAMRVAPGAGRRRGLMARIDVDEQGAAGVQSDRHLSGKLRRVFPPTLR